jgi:pyruvate/2-oxoglutarate dehydrogenase complex dihydrolipoamide acyltransferase (E2) component
LVALTATRRAIAARMLEAHQSVPVAWMAVEADVTGLVQLRAAAKEQFLADEGVALTYLPFFVQAIAARSSSTRRSTPRTRPRASSPSLPHRHRRATEAG